MTPRSLIQIASQYRWTIAAVIFFLAWKFILIGVLWDNRDSPPEPDDSYTYIANIASVSDCTTGPLCSYPGVSMNDHSGLTYLSYRLVFGSLARFLDISAESMFYVSFFIGTILVVPVLIFFLRTFTKRDPLIAIGIVFLALYHGTGESHGFYWVVPSFFSAALFLLLFAYANKSTPHFNVWVIALLSIVYAFAHPIGLYLVVILPLYFLIHWFLSRELDSSGLKRSAFIITIVIACAIVQWLYLPTATDYYGLGGTVDRLLGAIENISASGQISEFHPTAYDISGVPQSTFLGQKIANLHTAYFRFFFPHWLIVFPFGILLFLLNKKKECRLLALYFASLTFFIAATFLNEFGFRSAIILWPVTYLLFAFGLWHILQVIRATHQRYRRPATIVIITGTVLFAGINMLAALTFNTNINQRNNYHLDPEAAAYILHQSGPSDTLSLPGVFIRTTAGADLYAKRQTVPLSEHPSYIVDIIPAPSSNNQSSFGRFISQIFRLPTPGTQARETLKPDGYDQVAIFGDLVVYRIGNYDTL